MAPQYQTPMQNRQVLEAIGRRIRNVRTSLGLSHADVQRKHGIHAAVIGSFERADRGISVDKLYQIAQAFGVTVATLLPDGEELPTPIVPELIVSTLQTMVLELGELASAVEEIRKHLAGEVQF